MADVRLPNAYRGDSYSFTLTFPNASYLTGAPANVLAQIRQQPEDTEIAATWATAVNGAVLTCSLAEVALAPGPYVTDVSVGATTYLKNTPFRVDPDVSRPVVVP
jgi:hypothetical protein